MRLRSPELGLPGQGLRFAIAGATVAAVYITITTVLGDVVGLPFEVALAVGFTTSIAAHFALQRSFVWVHHEEFALAVHWQAARYLVMAGAQYGLTAASTALLPGPLHVDTEVVYLATLAVITPTTFVLFRQRVFHPHAPTATGETMPAQGERGELPPGAPSRDQVYEPRGDRP